MKLMTAVTRCGQHETVRSSTPVRAEALGSDKRVSP